MTEAHSVLIADDDGAMRAALGEAFARRGFRIVLCADGQETISVVRRELVHVALLDMHMPRLSGLEALEQMGRLKRPPARVLMSSAMDDRLREAALQARADAVLAKPFSLALVVQTVSGLLADSN